MKALIVVDVQNDFVEGGALGCDGGLAVADNIAELIRDSSYDLVVFSLDWHNPETNNDGHFSLTPDYVNTWPRHCEAGTPGAETVEALADVPDVTFVRKGFDEEAYSAFEGADHTGRSLAKVLADADIDSVDVVGIAFDYCVRETALDAADIGLNAAVLYAYCASVHPDIDPLTTRALQSGGVTVN